MELIRDTDSKGESFVVKVNWRPIFLKGANWIPADNITTKLKTKDKKSLMLSAVEKDKNTHSVKGEGI